MKCAKIVENSWQRFDIIIQHIIQFVKHFFSNVCNRLVNGRATTGSDAEMEEW